MEMSGQVKAGKLRGKVAIVTGGGSGIGAATSRLFAEEGASVVVTDLDEEAALRIAKEIDDAGGQAVGVKVDVTRKEEIEKAVKEALDRWGRIDILVNSAGMGELEWFLEGDEETWDKLIEVNLKGTMLFCRVVLPSMVERKYGKIINVASAAGKIGAGMQVVYSAAKAGVEGFTKSLAREVARYRINVNVICPGPTDTPMFGQLSEENPKLYDRLIQATAQRRLGRPEEQAAAALFLASDDAEFVTGHSLLVDGGTTMI